MEGAERPTPVSLRSRVRQSRRASGKRMSPSSGWSESEQRRAALNLGLRRRSLPDGSMPGAVDCRLRSRRKLGGPPSGGLVEAERRVALLEHAPAAQLAVRVLEAVLVVVLDDEQSAFAEQLRGLLAEGVEHGRVVLCVRRVEVDDVPRAAARAPVAALRGALEELGGVGLDDLGHLFGDAAEVEVRFDEAA